MTIAKVIAKPAVKENETLRPHVTRDGRVIYVPTVTTVSKGG